MSIPQLYEFVKTHDQSFNENSTAIGCLDHEAEIEAQNKFSKVMEVLAEKGINKKMGETP